MTSHDSLADLLARCALHDRRAFEVLYQQAAPMLYGLLLKVTRDRELAADLLQEGFVRIWQRAGDYRPTLGQPLTWMGTIVRRLAIDQLRRGDHRRRGELDEDGWGQLADAGPGPEERLHTKQGDTASMRCLDTLDPEPRRAAGLLRRPDSRGHRRASEPAFRHGQGLGATQFASFENLPGRCRRVWRTRFRRVSCGSPCNR